MLTALLLVFFVAGVLYDRWSRKLSARGSRPAGHNRRDDSERHLATVDRKQLRASAMRELPFLLIGPVAIYVLYLRPAWLDSPPLLALCAGLGGIFCGMVAGGTASALARFVSSDQRRL